MKEKIINIGVDIETLSTLPTAAIVSIAAKEFSLDETDDNYFVKQFKVNINATSCALNNYHIETETCQWWSERSDSAKDAVLNGDLKNIKDALQMFRNWVLETLEESKSDEVHVWMQGTDFDGSVLRYALRKEFPELGRKAVPWKHDALRDSRTYILESVRLLYGEVEDPYSVIPKPKNTLIFHDPMGDVDQMIWNIQYIHKALKEKVKQVVDFERGEDDSAPTIDKKGGQS